MNKKKVLGGLLCMLIYFFFLKTDITFAATYGGEVYLQQGQALPDATLSCTDCPTLSSTCWNSQSVGVTDCGNACNGGTAWTRYTYGGCYFSSTIVCNNYWVYFSDACSTADKYNSANPPVLNAGFCDCSVGGAYKTCCSGTTPVDAQPVNLDPYPPPEGQCGGATVVYCGQAGQPACGQNACNTLATPTPSSTGCSNAPTTSPPKWTPQTVYGSCNPSGQFCNTPCTDTCTLTDGSKCSATSCKSWWQCQGGTQWYNDGTYYSNCPTSCKNCIQGQTQTICSTTLSCQL